MCHDQLYLTDSNLAQLHLRVWENKTWFSNWLGIIQKQRISQKETRIQLIISDNLDDYIKFTFTANALVQC